MVFLFRSLVQCCGLGQVWNWFVEKLVDLSHPKHLLVGAGLCYELQFQSPTDLHLACAGMDCNPRVQSTPGPLNRHHITLHEARCCKGKNKTARMKNIFECAKNDSAKLNSRKKKQKNFPILGTVAKKLHIIKFKTPNAKIRIPQIVRIHTVSLMSSTMNLGPVFHATNAFCLHPQKTGLSPVPLCLTMSK